MSGVSADWQKLQTKTTQASILGARSPPDMSQVDAAMLKAASPTSFNLTQTTRTDQALSEAQAQRCRTEYQGFGGLRKLQEDQADHTYYQPGCGWLYEQGTGVTNPTINRGVLATPSGPIYGGLGDADEVRSGITFTMDLEKAERRSSQTLASRLNQNCRNLQDLTTDTKNYFGFCKTTKRIIPIQTVDGQTVARYPKDSQLGCVKADIVAAKNAPGACPTEEGYVDFGTQDTCTTLPFSKACLLHFTRTAGCTDKGSLIQALNATNTTDTYDTVLKTTDAYKYYTAKTNLTPALFRDGSIASRQVAIEELSRLAQQARETPSTTKNGIAAAARDLCLQKDYFLESFDFCSEITPQTMINTETLKCAQALWRREGGDSRGFLYPTLTQWSGKTIGQLQQFISSLINDTKSKDKSKQADAIRNFIGVESYKEVDILPRSPNICGAEHVWIYYENWNTEGARPIILRCDQLLRNSVGLDIYPFINNDLVEKYGMPNSEGIALMSAFEIRPLSDQQITFRVTTDDGFMLGNNQFPGQGVSNNTDYNVFQYQGPTTYTTPSYTVESKKSNVFTSKWFQGPGGATLALAINEKVVSLNADVVETMFLTQEPNAPWLQYEICSRPNNGHSATVGFFEKRWNGSCAFPWQNGTRWRLQEQKPIPSFDCEWSQVSFSTDSRTLGSIPVRGCMSFTTNSWWRTKASFAFNSMKTMTLLVRPKGNLSAGSMGSILWWPGYHNGWSSIGMETPGLWLYTVDGNTYHFDFWIGNRGHSYMECKINDWNLIVIQIMCDRRGVQKFSAAAAPLDSLRTSQGQSDFYQRLAQQQSATGAYSIPAIRNSYEKGYSGPIIAGGGNPEGTDIQRYSFTGDIAWIHGFNHLLTREMINAEVNQTWRSRWPVPALTTPDKPRQKVIGNNGTVSCDTYCKGTNGAPWNNELPSSWNGAQCVGTNLLEGAAACSTTPGMRSGLECICEPTNNGWVGKKEGFQGSATNTPSKEKKGILTQFKW